MLSPVYPDYDALRTAWRVPYGLRLHWRRLGGTCTVFNDESGDTHFLPSCMAEVLRAITARPGFTAVGRGVGEDGVDSALRELFELGLIEPASAGRR